MAKKLPFAPFKNLKNINGYLLPFQLLPYHKKSTHIIASFKLYDLKELSIPIWMSWLEVLNLLTQSCSCLCQEISCQNWGQFDQEMGFSEITKSSKKMEKIKKGSLTHNWSNVSMNSNWNFCLFLCLLFLPF